VPETTEILAFNKLFPEDWNLSQFWYTPETAEVFAQEAKRITSSGGKIACISSPSVYNVLKDDENAFLFEYDKRFEMFGKNFIYYDYNKPLDVPKGVIKSFNLIIMDPPHLSEDCLTKVISTAKFLSVSENTPWIVCTGAIMEPVLARQGTFYICDFQPHHIRQLLNPFTTYINYKSEYLTAFPLKQPEGEKSDNINK